EIGAEAALTRTLRLLLLDQRHRTVEPDRQHIVAGGEVGVGLAMLHIGTEAADAGQDRLAVVGMLADLAREREQAERAGEVHIVGRSPFRQARTLGLLAVDRFAELQVGPEAARAQRHLEAARRILAELLHAAIAVAVPRRQLAGKAAFGIVGAADKAAELAELERELAGLAVRAFARIGAVGARRKQV